MKHTRPALSKEFIRLSLKTEEMNRPTGGLLMIGVGIVVGAAMLEQLSPPREWVLVIIAVALIMATIGGAIHHPIGRFWMRGAFAGLLVGAISLATTFFYLQWRFGASDFTRQTAPELLSLELFIPSLIGALPGIGVYYLMMRNETVDDP